MVVEIINTGSELMLGRVLNTHQQWLCRELADLGLLVTRQVAIPDTPQDISTAIAEALEHADLVFTTGGLGPTSDDLTRDKIAELLGRKLYQDEASLRKIEAYFTSRNRATPPSTLVQAMVPEGAIVLPNAHGTAPGLAIEVPSTAGRRSERPSWIIMLPGPPRELRPMFRDSVVPLLERIFPHRPPYICHNLRTTGIGESLVEELIAKPLQPYLESGLQIGYCARTGQVDVRLSAQGVSAAELVEKAESVVKELVGPHLCSIGDEDIEAVVVRLMIAQQKTLALAESCTGGFIAHRITNVPGCSAVFLAGYVTYSNLAKEQAIGVDKSLLEQHGAVSEPVAAAMAEGALARAGADYALAVTGIAGPSGGSREKPVGTVFIALAGGGPTVVFRNLNNFDRETFKYATSQQALDLLRRRLCRV